MRRLRTFVMAILAVHIAGTAMGRQANIAGLIVSIVPPVYLRTSSTGAEIQLDPKRDIARALIQGQAIRAGSSGRVTIRFPNGVRELTAVHGRYEILMVTTSLSEQQRHLSDALNKFGRPAGSRGLQAPIYSPANGGAVRIDRLVVRWTPDAIADSATFDVRSGDDRVIWSSGDIPDRPGQLPATLLAALRTALATRSAGQGVSLTATLKRGTAVSTTAFRLLSTQDQQTIEARLVPYDVTAEPLASAIGRAFELTAADLLNEASDEWERALVVAPSSEAVMRAAIEAHDRTGNAARVRELTALLAAGPGRK